MFSLVTRFAKDDFRCYGHRVWLDRRSRRGRGYRWHDRARLVLELDLQQRFHHSEQRHLIKAQTPLGGAKSPSKCRGRLIHIL